MEQGNATKSFQGCLWRAGYQDAGGWGRQGTEILVKGWLKWGTLLAGGQEAEAEGAGRERAEVLEGTG